MFPSYYNTGMHIAKVLGVGSNLGVAIPKSIERDLGWLKGDHVAIFVRDGDVVIRNDTQRATRFTHERAGRRDERVAAGQR
jgi:bifunctional DNA-binding transcriptional regulator/antitoxin component of YhaV-PrlF toxin-antitoxin module